MTDLAGTPQPGNSWADPSWTEGLRIPKAADLVAARLREQIIRGSLPAGAELPPEPELLKLLGVGRPALREALRILESESLVRVRRGSKGGATVHQPDRRVAARTVGHLLQAERTTLRDVYQTRIIIEPPAARLVATSPHPDRISQLDEGLQEEALTLDDPIAFARASARFHDRIVTLAGVKTLALIAYLLSDITDRFMSAAMASTSHTPKSVQVGMRRAYRAHRHLVELVQANDGDAAEQFWRRHLELAGHYLLEDGRGDSVIDLLG